MEGQEASHSVPASEKELLPSESVAPSAPPSSWGWIPYLSSRPVEASPQPAEATPAPAGVSPLSYVTYVPWAIGGFLSAGISSLVSRGGTASADESDIYSLHIKEFPLKLRQPEAKEILLKVEEFVKQFSSGDEGLSFEEQSKLVYKFVDGTIGDLHHNVLWKSLPEEESKSILIDCLENYVMQQLYDRVMATSQLHNKDAALAEHLASLQFLWPCHLGIPSNYDNNPLWDTAQERLYVMHSERTPSGKLNCMNYLMVISLTHPPLLQEHLGDEIGLDHLLPVLIYVVLKSNPPFLQSSMGYILNFRHPSKMVADMNYYFVNFLSAVHFLENLSPSLLDISPEDYELGLSDPKAFHAKMEEQKKKEEEEKEQKQKALDDYDRHSESENDEEDPDWIYIKRTGESLHVCTETLVTELKQKSRGTQTEWSAFLQQIRAVDDFLTCKAEDLSLEDVSSLLAEYRKLVSKNHGDRMTTGQIKNECEKEAEDADRADQSSYNHKACSVSQGDEELYKEGANVETSAPPSHSLSELMEKEIYKLSLHGPSPTREQILKLFESQTQEGLDVKL